jgi:hypothetical protein
MKRMQSEHHYWFRARRFGYGWTPSTWQGWAVVGVWIVVFTGLAVAIPAEAGHAPLLVTTIVANVAITLALVAVCWKTGEPARWRWGS